MLLNNKKRKKFSKKYTFLETTLIEFLNWRLTTLDFPSPNLTNSNANSISNNKISKNLELEKIRVKEANFFSQLNKFNSQEIISFDKTILNQNLNHKKNFIFNPFQINPGHFFPQKKVFMQYWIFPFIGFVGLTWNKNLNLFEKIYFKQNIFNSDIADIHPSFWNKKNLKFFTKKNGSVDMRNHFYSSFTFPSKDLHENKNNHEKIKSYKDFNYYYFIAQNELQNKILAFGSNELNSMNDQTLQKKGFNNTFNNLNQNHNSLIILSKNPFDSSKFSILSNSFLWCKMLNNNNLLNFSLNFNNKPLNNKNSFESYLYEKSPTKIFLFPIKPLTISQTKKTSEPFYSVINIPNNFCFELNKKNLTNFPICSYEKAKVFLDNVTKFVELDANNLKFENISSINSLEKLKNKNYIINNYFSKSTLLGKFILLKMDPKNKSSNKIKNFKKSLILKRNEKDKIILKKIPITLKYDLDKFLFLKQFRSKIHDNFFKLDNDLKINLLSDFNFKNLNSILMKFKTIKEKNPLNKLHYQNIQNFIFEISILNYWKNSLNQFHLYEKNTNYPFQIFGNKFDNTLDNSKTLHLSNFLSNENNLTNQSFVDNLDLKSEQNFVHFLGSKIQVDSVNIKSNLQFAVDKVNSNQRYSQVFLPLSSPLRSSKDREKRAQEKRGAKEEKKIKQNFKKNNLTLNKNYLIKLFNIQKQLLKLNKKQKNKNQNVINLTTPSIPVKLNNLFIASGCSSFYKNKQYFVSNHFYDSLKNFETKTQFKEFSNNFRIKFFWDNHFNRNYISNTNNVTSFNYDLFITTKENYSNLNFYRKHKKLLRKLVSKPIIFKINKSFQKFEVNIASFDKVEVKSKEATSKTVNLERREAKERGGRKEVPSNLPFEKKEKKFQRIDHSKKFKKLKNNHLMNFIWHLKQLWLINSTAFQKQFFLFLTNLSMILDQNFKKILFYESKLISMDYKTSDFYKKRNYFHSLKLIKRKKHFKNNSFEIQNFKTNLKKNKKEKIFRTLLSYKSSGENSKIFFGSEFKKSIKSNKLKKPFIRLKRRIKQLRITRSYKKIDYRISLKILNKTLNKSYKKKKNQEKISSKFLKSKMYEESKIHMSRSVLKNKSSLNHLFRRLGFVFLSELKTNEKIFLNNPYASRQKEDVLKRFEKDKSLQKKRRRKKLKLETRRRKKRKRFYPRPIWLRYSLYKKFLNQRHFYVYNDLSIFKSKNKNRIQIKNGSKIKSNNKYNKFPIVKFFVKNQKLKDKIYRNNKQKWGNFIQDTPKFEKISLKKLNYFSHLPIYQNKEYYKVSNRILAEFQPLCWKSYWLRSNLTPYMDRIQKNFDKMKTIEQNNNFSNINLFLSKLLGFFSYGYSYNMLEILPFYSDFRNSFDNQQAFYLSNLSTFESINKIAEYNRIEFERLSEILKNVKFNMNLEGQNKPKSYKFTAWKYLISLRELKAQNKKNFWNRFAYNMPPNLSSVSPFVMLSNIPLNTNSSLKPYKSNATLRVLWSFNKTNQFTFKEKNQIRNLWETSKLRDQLKSNQTKKFLMNLIKVKNNLYFNDSFLNSEQNKLRLKKFKNFKKMNLSTMKKYETIQKKLVLMTLFQPKSYIISFNKGNVHKKNNISINTYIRFLKQKITNLTLNSKKLSKKNQMNWDSSVKNSTLICSFLKKKQDSSFLWESKPRLLKPSSFFWWSGKNYSMPLNLNIFNSFDIIYKNSYNNTNKKELLLNKSIPSSFASLFFFDPSLLRSAKEREGKSEKAADQRSALLLPSLAKQAKAKQAKAKQANVELTNSTKQNFELKSLISTNILIFSILFHLSILFSFVRIPELRGVLKFQLLLFYKISNNYFIVLYSIYNLLKKYKKQVFIVYNNFYKKSYNFLYKKNIFDFESNLFLNKKMLKIYKNQPFLPLLYPFSTTNFLCFLSPRSFRLRLQSKRKQSKRMQEKRRSEGAKERISKIGAPRRVDNFNNEKKEFNFENNLLFNQTYSYNLNQQIFDWNLNIPKIINKDWKVYGLSLNEFKDKNWQFNNSFIKKRFSETPFIYSISNNFVQYFYSKKLFNQLILKMKISQKKQLNNSLKIPNALGVNLKKVYFKSLYRKGFSFISFQTQFALFFLFLSYNGVRFSTFLVESSYQFLLKIIDLFESFLLIIYKFLEKPAELMIEWIAQFFLIEWSSDVSTFIPETFDMYFWNSFQKFFRYSRILGFVEFQNSTNIYHFMNALTLSNMYGNSFNNEILSYELNIKNKMPFTSYFFMNNIFGFFMQRRLWNFFHLFIDSMLKPDIDLMVRQKKGKIFWDIWAEILIRAAEQYNINIPSLTSLKEEQEKLIERLIQDPAFVSFYQNLEDNEFNTHDHSLISNSNKQFIDSSNFNSNPLFVAFFDSKTASTLLSKEVNFNQRFKAGFKFLSQKNKNLISSSFLEQKKGLIVKTRSKISKQKYLNKNQNNLYIKNLFKTSYKTKSWSSNQYITFNLKDTDLFLDISPPKSLLSVNFINSYEPIQYTLGSIMCEIYSGLFSMKVSKNLLIVNSQVSNFSNTNFNASIHSANGARSAGDQTFDFNSSMSTFNAQSRGSYGSLIIQALAGETEMKMMVDNANRYASIQRGIAVGMKLLRDVFESIVLQTPCFFLMEDIHVIGERRPMLISDDENSKATASVFGFEQDEESEKNQMIYQSSRHSINDFRRPYKGDFSMLIPTNLYNKDLYSFKKFQTNLKSNRQKKYPISLPSVEKIINEQSYEKDKMSNKPKSFNISCLEIKSENFFAPPATSPFTILMMKEQKKLKPKKIVKQILWKSFVSENIISSRTDSIRVKVAILADMTLRNFSVKLDMITDLLVIIDSVRSNRGFVVFATTHLPAVLDPALRRPGRFDETISLPLLPNLINRWSLFQMHFSGTEFQNKYSKETFDQFEYGVLTENFRLTQISDLISKTKLSIFNNYNTYSYFLQNNLKGGIISNSKNNKNLKIHSFISNKNYKNNDIFPNFLKLKNVKNSIFKQMIHPSQAFQSFFIDPNYMIDSFESNNYRNLKKAYSKLSFGYFQMGNILIISDVLKDQTSFSLYNKSLILDQSSPFVYHSLYSSLNSFKTFLMRFLGGKIAEFLIIKNPRKILKSTFPLLLTSSKEGNQRWTLLSPSLAKQAKAKQANAELKEASSKNKNNSYYSLLYDTKDIQEKNNKQTSSSMYISKKMNFSIIDQQIRYKSWHFATSWIFAILQKRFLYNKNLIITKMLSFDNPNQSSLREPPSPPASSLLMPSKKYENFKRMERDFQKKSVFSIYEKMQMHQKQRFLKKLYNKPVLDYFKSQLFENRLTSFDSSFKEFSYYKESILLKTSSSHFYYKNRLNIRHRFSLINQWWNGQLAEHNVEVTYLSDIDWRTMYIKTNSNLNNQKSKLKSISNLDQRWTLLSPSPSPSLAKQAKAKQEKAKQANAELTSFDSKAVKTTNFELNKPDQKIDSILDFPDADQHYNPRIRRWFLNDNSWNYWLNFETNFYYEIYYHMIYDSFNKTSSYFNENRELLDFFVSTYLQHGSLKELDFIFIFSRFYR